MKLARLFLAVLTVSTLAACSDSVTAPQAEPAAPSQEVSCTLEKQADGTYITRCGSPVIGSGG